MKIKSLILAFLSLAALVSCQVIPATTMTPNVSFSSEEVNVEAAGETKTVALSANCNWTASSSASWLEVYPVVGNGSTTLSFIVAENTSDAREATITVVGAEDLTVKAELLVSQASGKPAGPGPDPGTQPSGNSISTAAQLAAFLTTASDLDADATWTVEADIDCGGATIAPVTSFAATLDGKNHKIYNYTVTSGSEESGLFISLSGTVKNLILGSSDGKAWDGKSSVGFAPDTKNSHIGGVCAELSGTLENVKNFATVAAPLNNPKVVAIGGLVGAIDSPATVKDCENGALIQLSAGTMGNGAYVGGVVGHGNNAEALIQKCVNSANLEFSAVTPKYIMYGGIVGCTHLGTVVEDCQNIGEVSYNQSGTESAGNYMMIAGIAGGQYSGSIVRNCVNKAEISSNRMQVSRIGGITGTLNSTGIIEGCVNDGAIKLIHAAPNANWQSAGGICGFQEKEASGNIIRNNTNNGAVTVELENSTTHANQVAAGGIIGIGALGLEISGNVNKGAVTLTNKGAAKAYAGGIVAWFKASCFTKDNENSASVSSTDTAGGVAGYVGDKDASCTGDQNTGAVTGSGSNVTGSIAGNNLGSLVNCKAGGSVNGTAVTEANLGTLTQGTTSTGTATGTTLAK